jgi:molybdopterin molybdotransferase
VLTYDEALRSVLDNVHVLPPRDVTLAQAGGLVLACEVVADSDMPPFDRSAMDGFAVRCEDTREPGAILRNIGEQSAGGPPVPRALSRGECAAIYTGAAIPEGADAVVMVERTREENGAVHIGVAVARGENIRFRGEDVRRGELLLRKGTTLRPQEIAVCATFHGATVTAIPRPRLVVISTGDELVPPGAAPGPGEIPDSNGAMVAAQAARAGCEVLDVATVRDDAAAIRAAIESAAGRADILVMSGGVSMGARDFVAPVLQQSGFAGGFHKVKIRPGKPLWFGRRKDVVAFGLPGNPVSSFVTFELFVRPSIRRCMGMEPGPRFEKATVASGHAKPGDREQFLPARVDGDSLAWIPWQSSADFLELCRANALGRVSAGQAAVPGARVEYLPI